MRRLCRGLAVSLPIFILTLGLFFSKPEAALAQKTSSANKIGTHLIQGDYGAQADVIKKLIASNVLSINPHYPIVVMVDPANPNGLHIISDAIGSNSFQVILRINVHADTTNDMGAVANAIKQYFPDKSSTAVVVGNEINNQNIAANTPDPTDVDGEWKSSNYSAYGPMFNTICGSLQGYPCGISALDTINGQFDAAKILPQILGSINAGLITAVFANVYQTGSCGAYEAVRCGPGAGAWIQGKIKSGVPLYITEFGRVDCDSYDCIQGFYEDNNDVAAAAVVGFTRAPKDSTSQTFVHTVPAICEYWEQTTLNMISPDKCGGAKHPSFIYPGIEDMSPNVSKMRSMAAGYTLMCGNQFKIKGDVKDSAIANYNQNKPASQQISCSGPNPDGRCVVGGVWANLILDNSKTVIPLYRFQGTTSPNPDVFTRRTEDLEGFFSANYTKQELATGADFVHPLANGTSRKLIGEKEQCEMTIQYLRTIQQLCNDENNRSSYTYNDKLDADKTPNPSAAPIVRPPGGCALYAQIPGASSAYSTYEKILKQIDASKFSCDHPEKAPQGLYKEFSKIELTTPKGFKPAYLVHYINRPEQPNTGLDKRVNWQAPGELTNGGANDSRNISDRIKIVKVYVPAGFAETSIAAVNANPDLKEKQESYFPTFTGGFMQTITSLIPIEVQTKISHNRALIVKGISDFMRNNLIFTFSDKAIKCEACNQLTDEDPRSVIIRRINAGVQPQFDGITAIQPGTVCDSDELVGEIAKERVHTINPGGTLDPVMPAKITASATMVAKAGDDQETIRTYLLLPEEYRNIADYETPLLQTFVANDLQNTEKNPELKFVTNQTDSTKYPKASFKYLQLSNASLSIENPEKKAQFPLTYKELDPGAPPVINPDGSQSPGTRDVTVDITGQIVTEKSPGEIKTNPQVPGGVLARALWEVMCNVTRPYDGSKTIAYNGFEAFLQKQGIAACTDPTSPTAPLENQDQYLASEVATCNGTSGGITAGGDLHSTRILSSFVCCKNNQNADGTCENRPADQALPDIVSGTNKAWMYQSSLDIARWKDKTDGGEELCNETFYSRVACTYSPKRNAPHFTLIAHEVDANGVYKKGTGVTACKYIVQQAIARNVSPRLALAIWGEESGFGAYDVADFGVVSQKSSRQIGSITAQVSGFLGSVAGKSDYLTFLRQYSGETTPDRQNFCNNKFFPYRTKDFYNNI